MSQTSTFVLVRVLDPDTKEVLGERLVENDYVLIEHGTCRVAHRQVSKKTHVLTIKYGETNA